MAEKKTATSQLEKRLSGQVDPRKIYRGHLGNVWENRTPPPGTATRTSR